MFSKMIQAAVVLTIAAASIQSVRAQALHEEGTAVVIPRVAMNDLLRCRHENRPETECFARLSREVGRSQVAANAATAN